MSYDKDQYTCYSPEEISGMQQAWFILGAIAGVFVGVLGVYVYLSATIS